MSCLFCDITSKKIPGDIIIDGTHIVACRDKYPQAPSHTLIIPKAHIRDITDIQPHHSDILMEIIASIQEVARIEDLDNGFRVVTNTGTDGGQTIPHLHFHVLGRRSMNWPPG